MSSDKKAATHAGTAQVDFRQQRRSSVTDQRARVYAFLRQCGSLSTVDARREIDVTELRAHEYTIDTTWSRETTPKDGTHRVARHHLISGVGA